MKQVQRKFNLCWASSQYIHLFPSFSFKAKKSHVVSLQKNYFNCFSADLFFSICEKKPCVKWGIRTADPKGCQDPNRTSIDEDKFSRGFWGKVLSLMWEVVVMSECLYSSLGYALLYFFTLVLLYNKRLWLRKINISMTDIIDWLSIQSILLQSFLLHKKLEIYKLLFLAKAFLCKLGSTN